MGAVVLRPRGQRVPRGGGARIHCGRYEPAGPPQAFQEPQKIQVRQSIEKGREILRLLRQGKTPSEEELKDPLFMELNQDASELYNLIHARFLNSKKGKNHGYDRIGQAKVYQKFLLGVYGYCPRALCDRQKTLPIGLNDQPRVSRAKVYCPKCEEVYVPKA